ncbi:MAG: nucleotidyltransferase family protein [Clostridiales Family XIII bacterium]|jgi:predicted nucleotidyltransferase|nr:nucleotidyltransferase family protein [Clostridiales Family XIII bacterium]
MNDKKVLGVIAEYDPFHKGHAYHLKAAKELSGADTVVCVMSGAFTQRGEPSMMGKYERAEAAVRSGVDLAVELPFAFATTGAENFAKGGVRLLAALGVDAVSFGSESGSLKRLDELAEAILCEDGQFKEVLTKSLGEGFSYAVSLQSAVRATLGEKAAAILNKPNDILGVEYLKEIKRLRLGGKLRVYPVIRKGAGPDEVKGKAAGAGAIRRMIREGNVEDVLDYLPAESAKLLLAARNGLLFPEPLFRHYLAALSAIDEEKLSCIFGMDEGLEYRLSNTAQREDATGYAEYLNLLKTRRYSIARLKRLLLHTVLCVRKGDVGLALGEAMCSKILAFNEKGRKLLFGLEKQDRPLAWADESLPAPMFMSNSKDFVASLAASPRQIGLQIKGDKLAHLLRNDSLAGFIHNPPPLSLP